MHQGDIMRLHSEDRARDDSYAAARLFGLAPTRVEVQLSESTIVSRIRTNAGDVAIKIFDVDQVDEPLARWRHDLAAHAVARGLPVPAPLASPSGELTVRARIGGRAILAQASAWSTGVALAYAEPDPQLLQDVGRTAARMVVALGDGPAPPTHDAHLWDLRRSGATLTEMLVTVSDPQTRIVGLRALRAFHAIERTIADLPQTIVHQDLHDENLLVGETPTGRGVVGILDFGDSTFGPRIADLVIPAAYSSRHARDPEAAVGDVVAGWQQVLPLSPAERSVVLPLSAVRLATNAVVWNTRADGERAEYAAARSRGSLSAAQSLLDALR